MRSYSIKFVSPKMDGGEIDYWFVVETNRCEEESENKFFVAVCLVSPQEVSDRIPSAIEYCGLTEDDITDDQQLVECLHRYGAYDQVWADDGPELKPLIRRAIRFVELSILFGIFTRKLDG